VVSTLESMFLHVGARSVPKVGWTNVFMMGVFSNHLSSAIL